MGKYATVDAIQKRLEGKVKFAAPGVQDANKMSLDLLNALIGEGESQLEIDLMMRYEMPFQGMNGEAFSTLPDTTKTALKTLSELICVIRVLETDFGRGTSANADKYTEMLQKRYDKFVNTLVERRKVNGEETLEWLRPPLPGIKAAYCNQGDSGFRGRAHNTTTISHEPDYAIQQINSPGEDFFNGSLDQLDRGNSPHGGNVLGE